MHLMRASTLCAVSNLVRAWGVSPQTKDVKDPEQNGSGPDSAADSGQPAFGVGKPAVRRRKRAPLREAFSSFTACRRKPAKQEQSARQTRHAAQDKKQERWKKMDKKELIKIVKEGVSFGLAALGIYNILLLVRYFKGGMDRSLIPLNTKLFLTDIAVVVLTALVVMLVELVSRKLNKNKLSDSSGTNE